MLARPIYVHAEHVARMACPNGCLGVEVNIQTDLHSAEHRGCAICRVDAGPIPPGTRTLRQCSNRLCHGRFHQTSYDDFHIEERVELARRKVASLLHRRAA